MSGGNATSAQREVEGKYTIRTTLGTGAGGETFEAIDVRDGSRIALKRLALSATRDWKAVELFQREARVLAGLNHPSIPRLRESFVVESEQGPVSYLAHDFAPGQSLRGWTEAGWRPDEAEVARIGCFLLDVLAYLHALHPPVIHRDIKPANVIRSEDGRLWLVDFGAVRDATVTMTGGSTVVGTYGYMAPEQFRGHAVFESDVYGVGATLLYLLSGRPPTEFPQEKLKVGFRGEVQSSEHLKAWLDRALEPAPEDRFPSALAALAALRGQRGALTGRKPRGSRARLIALLSILGAVVVGGAAFVVSDLRRESITKHANVAANPPAVLPPRAGSAFKVLRKGRFLDVAHTSAIFAMARSSDGKKLATGSVGSVKIWDAERGTVERALSGHEPGGEVRGLAFTREGNRLVTGDGTTIRIWDVQTGSQVGVLPLRGVLRLEITPDDKYIVASSRDGIVRVHDLKTQELVRSLSHGSPVYALALTPDGSLVASGGQDGSLKIWSVADGRVLADWSPHEAVIHAIAFAPDGQSIASVSSDHRAQLAHLAGGKHRSQTFSWTHEDIVFGVTFSPDGNYVLTTGRDGSIYVVNAVNGQLVSTRHDRTESIAHPLHSKDGRALLVAVGPGVMRLPVPRRGLGTEVPEPAPEPAVAPPPKDRDHALYDEATRLVRGAPAVPFSEAEEKVHEALAANPRSPLAWIANARLELYRGRNDKRGGPALARKHLEHAATLGPKGIEWWTFAIWLARAEKQPEAAREAVRQAYAIAAEDAEAILGEAQLDLDDTQYEKAITSVTRLVRAQPLGKRLRAAYLLLADAYREVGDIDAADGARRRALALSPKSAWAHGDYSFFLLEDVGDVARAIEEARTALSLMDYGNGRGNLAMALIERGNATLWGHGSPDEAIRDYDEAIRLEPAARNAYWGRAAAYRKKAIVDHDPRYVPKARADLIRVLEITPDWSAAKRALEELDAVAVLAKAKR
ncbi:MAG: protein kinase [Labilithrix sp.]|nr:protein kinase [Labilithrix sp.]